jgi:hypothetical protein
VPKMSVNIIKTAAMPTFPRLRSRTSEHYDQGHRGVGCWERNDATRDSQSSALTIARTFGIDRATVYRLTP